MRFTVGHIERPCGINEEPVGARELAGQWVCLWAIAALPATEHGRDDATLEVHSADDVILRVRHEQRVTSAIEGQSLGTTQLGLLRRTAVARVTLLPGAGDMMPGVGRRLQAVDGVAFTKRQIQRAAAAKGKRARAVESSPCEIAPKPF